MATNTPPLWSSSSQTSTPYSVNSGQGPGYRGPGDVDLGDAGLNAVWGARPGYQGTTDAKGNLFSQFQVGQQPSQMPWLQNQVKGLDYDASGGQLLQSMKGMVMNPDGTPNTSFSPYAQTMMNQAGGSALTGAQAGMTNAMNAAATHGGLDAGASQRMGMQAGANATNAYMGARQQIGAQDQAYKQNLLSGLPGAFDAHAGFDNNVLMGGVNAQLGQSNLEGGRGTAIDEFNVGNQVGDVYNKNGQGQSAWNTLGSMWGGNQIAQGDIMLANKPGGGFMGTGLGAPTKPGNNVGDWIRAPFNGFPGAQNN